MNHMFSYSLLQESFKPYKYHNLQIVTKECIICYESTNCYTLSCFKTHVICINCIKYINRCPLCRIPF